MRGTDTPKRGCNPHRAPSTAPAASPQPAASRRGWARVSIALGLLLAACSGDAGEETDSTAAGGAAGMGEAGGAAGPGGSGGGAGSGLAGQGSAGMGKAGTAGGGTAGQGGAAGASGAGQGAAGAGGAGIGGAGMSGAGQGGAGQGGAGQGGAGKGGAGKGGAGKGGAGSGGVAGGAGMGGAAGQGGAGQSGAGEGGAGGMGGAAGIGGLSGQGGGPVIEQIEVVPCEMGLAPVTGMPPEVPQGATECLKITGSGLDSIVSASVGEAKGVSQGMVPGGALKVQFQVPHGAVLGPRTLLLVLPGGQTKVVAQILTVTPIFVSELGSDLNGRGSMASPFHSLGYALAQANGGASLGDVVSLLSNSQLEGPTDVPEGVDLEGQGNAVTSNSEDDSLQLLGKNKVTKVDFTGFPKDAVHVMGDKVDLIDVSASGNGGYGMSIRAAGAAVTASGKCDFSNNYIGVGLYGAKGASFHATGCTFKDNGGEALSASESAAITLDQCLVEGNASQGYQGITVAIGGSIEIFSSTLKDNGASNLLATQDTGIKKGNPGPVHIKDSTISGGHVGLVFEHAASVLLENVTVSGAETEGIRLVKGTTLTITGDPASSSCVIEQNGGSGVLVDPGAGATITGCAVRHNGEGITTGGTLTLADSTLEGNGPNGLHAIGGPAIALSNNTVTGHQTGFLIDAGAGISMLSVTGGSFANNDRAVQDEGGAIGPFSLSQISFSAQAHEALSLKSAGATITISGCTFAANAVGGSEILLARALQDGIPPVSLAGLTFDGTLAPDPGQLHCPPDSLVSIANKARVNNLGQACFSW